MASFGDPIIKVLLIALAVNVLFLFRHFDWYESAGIALAIFLATFVSTLSEYGSESAFEKMQEDAARISCRVRRSSGVIPLPIGEIVCGDLVLLQAGEMIPADGVLFSGHLSVDQSALNGESKEADKRPGEDNGQEADFLNPSQLFRGSVVCSGDGVMLVKRVGDATFYGRMAWEVQEETRESPLKVRLAGLAKIISRIGYVAAVCVAVADLFHSLILDNGMNSAAIMAELSQPALVFGHVLHALTLAITVVVVAVPEGLPMMITVVLSSNMLRMMRDHVLVRKLVGIETSGSLNILFTDKTGTLTKGRLEVQKFLTGDATEYRNAGELARRRPLWELVELSCVYNSASLVSRGKALGGNATDRALLEYVLPKRRLKGVYRTEEAVPFDSARKYSAVRVRGGSMPGPGDDLILIKGAPERLLARCTRYYDEKGSRPASYRFLPAPP